ncbi:2762_t:CDS:2 [Acaulospora morrowiae]|uniref:2762_t:CDS:1 n=1 Tax=Acaulospora morrowiae TaxID=94023 RepID=A0A9N8VAX2_9GLOM|nr:2762_t:CDS:2 [Acaulospora morrowiae]
MKTFINTSQNTGFVLITFTFIILFSILVTLIDGLSSSFTLYYGQDEFYIAQKFRSVSRNYQY